MSASLQQTLETLASSARQAAPALAQASSQVKNTVLEKLALLLEKQQDAIFKANQIDLKKGEANGLSAAMLDRLRLTSSRMKSMIDGVRQIKNLPDPVGEVLREWTQPNGLFITKVRVPIGVIGIIYESRPNVTIDASILCLKSGNVTVLRGGSEAFESNRYLANLFCQAAQECGLPPEVVTFIPTTDRQAIPILCKLDKSLDLMIPRGGRGLIETVVENARMPVIKHFEGICHIYVHAEADLAMAEKIILNAKCQRPGTCNAVETVLIDTAIAKIFVPQLVSALKKNGVKIFADATTSAATSETFEAPTHWDMEYLDLILAIRVVKNLNEAVSHIEQYGSHHSDAIITENAEVAESFLKQVDSAAVYWNASTRFTDGYEFGFGAEIGISTDKIHARGPMALEELTSYKYIARGPGLIRSR